MTIQSLGHACIYIHGSKKILIDPFIRNNPKSPLPIENIPPADYILVTHDHMDHMGDAVELLQRDGSILVAIFEIMHIPTIEALPNEKINLNIGGAFSRDGITIRMTPALHSAGIGVPAGFVIDIDGKRIFHSGDTAYFRDLSVLPLLDGPLDVACLPIGGHYTMDVKQAALAVQDLVPAVTIPIHYGTWPVIDADTSEFTRLSDPNIVRVLAPGESLSL